MDLIASNIEILQLRQSKDPIIFIMQYQYYKISYPEGIVLRELYAKCNSFNFLRLQHI